MIPDKYKFLNEIGTLPKLISTSLQYLGLHEVVGKGSNPIIIQMAKQLGVSNIYTDDDIAWCALYQNYICLLTDKPLSAPLGNVNLLRAISFITWGEKVELENVKLGDLIVFSRKGGNHIAPYIAESKNTYHILGGNQNNQVSFIEKNKTDAIEARRFYKIGIPASVKKYFIDSSGKVSTNEA